ncbi:MAG: type II toxin-antitoxin system HicB family antitoxin [Chitinivibrionia bacterium]|nr:type II toxin-antitoxin system HicB family antitoxin [Chitinivibrionia bacterium]
MRFNGTAVIWREDDWFVAMCVENNITSQGRTMDLAIENLKEALALYYEDEVVPNYSTRYITPLELAV